MYKRTTLKNGIRIVTHPMKERDSVALGYWAKAGGRYEDDKTKGSAHFLEHILFKGSRKYPCRQIKELIEGVGGTLNAFTSEELTCYYAKIPSRHINKTFDVLADMVADPLINKKDVDKERTVILEEIKMYNDLPQYLVAELLEEMLWPGHPLGKNIAGTTESVGNLTYKDLRDSHRRYYTPENLVVSACGNIKPEYFEKLVKRKMSHLAKGEEGHFERADNTQSSPRIKFLKKDIEQMHVALGMLGLDSDHKDKYVLGLLHIILGGNMSSRLFNEVREKRGLAYSIGTSIKALQDTGAFVVRAGVDNKKIVDAVGIILKELQKIKRNGIALSEFNRAKDYYLGQAIIGLEDSLEHMIWIGESVVSHNRVRTLKDIVKQVNKINPADIKRISKQIFNENRYNLSVVGPITQSQEKQLCRLINARP